MSNTPETPPAQPAQLVPFVDDGATDLMWSSAGFAHAQRLAAMFAASVLIPEHLRNKVADVTIALLMARRLNEDPLVVMQNIHVIHGRAGWSAQYIVARANRSGVFRGRINWRQEGKGNDMVVTAYATLGETGEEVSFPVGMQMAIAEGWTKNTKYKSMPELMLRYRSATFLVRLFAPEIMLGIPTSDELDDIDAPIPRTDPAGPLGALGLPTATVAPIVTIVDAQEVPAASTTPPAKAKTPKAPKPPESTTVLRECIDLETSLTLDQRKEIRSKLGVHLTAPVSNSWPAATLEAYRDALKAFKPPTEQLAGDVAKARARRALLDSVQMGVDALGEEGANKVAAALGLDRSPQGVLGLSDEQLTALAKALSVQVEIEMSGGLGE